MTTDESARSNARELASVDLTREVIGAEYRATRAKAAAVRREMLEVAEAIYATTLDRAADRRDEQLRRLAS